MSASDCLLVRRRNMNLRPEALLRALFIGIQRFTAARLTERSQTQVMDACYLSCDWCSVWHKAGVRSKSVRWRLPPVVFLETQKFPFSRNSAFTADGHSRDLLFVHVWEAFARMGRFQSQHHLGLVCLDACHHHRSLVFIFSPSANEPV